MAGARFAQHGTVFEIELVCEGPIMEERRIGSGLPTERATFDSASAARRAYFLRTSELLETAWRRVSRCEGMDPEQADAAPALKQLAATGDADARAIYSDALMATGDPCGELSALRRAAATGAVRARIEELEHTDGVALYGLFGALPRAWWAQFELTWEGGWIDTIRARHQFMTDGRAMTDAAAREGLHQLLHAPMARFVRCIELDATFAAAARLTFAGCPRVGSLRALTLLEPVPPADELVAALPGLHHMTLQGGLVSPGHPTVESLAITVRLDAHAWLTGEWPALRRLELQLATAERAPLGSVGKLLSARRLAGVTELVLTSERYLPAFLVDALVEGPLIRTLERLTIRAPLHPGLAAKLQTAAERHGFAL